MATKLACFGTRIIIRKAPVDDKYGGDGGLIYKPEAVKDRTTIGVVEEIGPECLEGKGRVYSYTGS